MVETVGGDQLQALAISHPMPLFKDYMGKQNK